MDEVLWAPLSIKARPLIPRSFVLFERRPVWPLIGLDYLQRSYDPGLTPFYGFQSLHGSFAFGILGDGSRSYGHISRPAWFKFGSSFTPLLFFIPPLPSLRAVYFEHDWATSHFMRHAGASGFVRGLTWIYGTVPRLLLAAGRRVRRPDVFFSSPLAPPGGGRFNSSAMCF